jgi:hypothetical protein
MKVWKKVLSIALCFALFVSLMPSVMLAEGAAEKITVTLRVEGANGTSLFNESFEVESMVYDEVLEDYFPITVFQFMKSPEVVAEGFRFDYQLGAWGPFITSVMGVQPPPPTIVVEGNYEIGEHGVSWMYNLNGSPANFGAGTQTLTNGNIVLWFLDPWENFEWGFPRPIPMPAPRRPSGGGGSQPAPTPTPIITPVPTPTPAPIFTDSTFNDIPADFWGKPAVEFVVERGLFAGVWENQFVPDGSMTRAMVATVMQRMSSKFSASNTASIEENWYDGAMQWAVEAGILAGTHQGLEPNANVTREQLATILWRYSESPSASGGIDVQNASDWAIDSMRWAVERGIMRGDSAGLLNPHNYATRIEVAVIMQRYIERVLETPDLDAIRADVAEFLMSNNPNPSISSIGGDWIIYGLAKNNLLSEDYKTIYRQNVGEIVRTNNGVLSEDRYTEYARVAIALSAAGFDARNIEGHNLLAPLLNHERVERQGINGPIFALMALGENEHYRDSIISKQLDNGMFAFSGMQGSPDITAMAIQALGKCEASERAADALEKANITSTESFAQAIIAFGILERDIPQSWIDGLLAGYERSRGFNNNAMSTEQAFIALGYLK